MATFINAVSGFYVEMLCNFEFDWGAWNELNNFFLCLSMLKWQ